jgi:hypothetical protein
MIDQFGVKIEEAGKQKLQQGFREGNAAVTVPAV